MKQEFIDHCNKLSAQELQHLASDIIVSNVARGCDMREQARELIRLSHVKDVAVFRRYAMKVAYDVRK